LAKKKGKDAAWGKKLNCVMRGREGEKFEKEGRGIAGGGALYLT